MMKKLIYADDISERLERVIRIGAKADDGEHLISAECVLSVLKSLPTVDAVEVVRCKDCKHNPKLEWFGCPMASLSEKQRPETAWCWKGERKDGNGNV